MLCHHGVGKRNDNIMNPFRPEALKTVNHRARVSYQLVVAVRRKASVTDRLQRKELRHPRTNKGHRSHYLRSRARAFSLSRAFGHRWLASYGSVMTSYVGRWRHLLAVYYTTHNRHDASICLPLSVDIHHNDVIIKQMTSLNATITTRRHR